MYLLDNIMGAVFGAMGGYDFFVWSLSLYVVVIIVAALVRPFIGDI